MTRRRHTLHLTSVVTVIALLGSLLVALFGRPSIPMATAQEEEAVVSPRGPEGGPPEGLTTELIFGDTRYLFDRILPIDPTSGDYTEVAQTDNATVYARGDQQPFDRLYVTLPENDANVVARYLPQTFSSENNQCLAEALDVGAVDAGESGIFVFAGLETDLTTDLLQDAGTTSDGSTFYVGSEQPFEEFFVDAPDGLQRFVRTDDQGLPAVLTGDVAFGGQLFTFNGAADVDPASLTRIGCAGPFPLFAGGEETGDLEQVITVVAGQAFAFNATGEDADTMTAGQVGDDEASPPTDASPDTTEPPADDEEGENASPSPEPVQETEEPTTDEADASPPADEESDTGSETTSTTATGTFPRELTINTARYLFDRLVPVNVDDLNAIGEQDGLTIFTRDDSAAPDQIYATAIENPNQVARYLAQTPQAGCLATVASFDVLDAGDAGQFVFAGIETDLTSDNLQEVGTTPDDQTIYAGDEQPFTELFVTGQEGLLRFIVLDEQGLLGTLGDEFPFAGQTFAFDQEATDIDLTALQQVGCATAFPVYINPDEEEGPFTEVYVSIGPRTLIFRATGATSIASPETTETTEASPVVEAPTETASPASPEATDVATETTAPTEPPTEQPTETPTSAPTETPIPTETAAPTETPAPSATLAPTEAPAPTETAAPTDDASPEANTSPTVEAPTATASPEGSPAAASPTAIPPTPLPTVAAPAELPQQITVQNTSYVFTQIQTTINVAMLIQVEVIQGQNGQLTIYAEQNLNQGVAVRLFAVTENQQVVGQYVPAAAIAPTPPPSLPQSVDVQGISYVFNEVSVNIDVQTLVQVQVIQIQNVSVTIYAERNVSGRPARLFCISQDGQVVGQYIDVTVVVKARTTIHINQSGPAVAATLPPNAPPAAAGTAIPRSNPCVGAIGPLDDNGVPRRLPRRVQLRGTSYAYIEIASTDGGTLTRIGCVGGYEALSSDQEPASTVIYLRIAAGTNQQATLFRYQAIRTINVSVQAQGQPRTITLIPVSDEPETSYSIVGSWQRSIYASVTVILFAQDAINANPPLLYGYDVDADVVGEYAPEGELQEPTEELQRLADTYGLNPDLVIAGDERYILVAVWEPTGSTTDGWVTFYASDQGDRSATVLGRDPRRADLFIYQRVGASAE